MVHNITSATRLLDLLTVFEGDRRVQTVFTCTESSALDEGTLEFFTSRGMLHIPWEEATVRKFDMAIATSRGGDLHNLRTPLIGAPHGAGYNKLLKREAGSGKREAGSGKREAGSGKREAGSGKREAFGLSPEWLMHDGRVVPSAIILSHDEQRERLAASCPEAVPVSVVAGDPCFDQLQVSAPFREHYRRALGIRPGQKLILVSSTWGRGSILASDDSDTDFLRRVLAELPVDEYRVLAAIHPNAWYGHGAWQLQNWLAPLTEHGLLLPVPDTETWKAALLAADGILGDHGSLTMYGIALGIPAVLGSFSESKVAPHSPMARLGEILPRLSARRPFLPQIEEAAAVQQETAELHQLRETVTSRPGESATLLRRLLYQWLELPEPVTPATPRLVPVPSAVPVGYSSPVERPVYVSASSGESRATVRRYPAPVQRRTMERHLAATHLVADIDDPDARWSRSADVLILPLGRPRHLDGLLSGEDIAARYPGCALLAIEESEDGCLALLRDGVRLRARWQGERPSWASAAIAASVVYDHALSTEHSPRPVRIQVAIGAETEAGLLDIALL
ncbi:hypothetical protein [Streptomyces bluensis]|uniref:Uncharacterized protein n=1 Tax=Streptomyces bluensis TaxID=33897 RepID=A0ABW6UBC7_9ACTN